MKLARLVLASAVLASSVMAAENSGGESVAVFLDNSRTVEERTRALAAVLADSGGVRLLTEAASTSPAKTSKAMGEMFALTSAEGRALIVHALGQSQDRASYHLLRSRALADEDSTVRAAAFGAAAIFRDYSDDVNNAIVREVTAANPGSALSASAHLATQLQLRDAVTPLVQLLKHGSAPLRHMAAQSLSGYEVLPAEVRPDLVDALRLHREEAERLNEAYRFLPAARPDGASPGEDTRNLLDRALAKTDVGEDATKSGRRATNDPSQGFDATRSALPQQAGDAARPGREPTQRTARPSFAGWTWPMVAICVIAATTVICLALKARRPPER